MTSIGLPDRTASVDTVRSLIGTSKLKLSRTACGYPDMVTHFKVLPSELTRPRFSALAPASLST